MEEANAKATVLRAWKFFLGTLYCLCGLATPVLARAQVEPQAMVSAMSHSGQFVVYGHRFAQPAWPLSTLLTNRLYVGLEPMLVTVSCERIKQMLLRELGAADTWRGKVHLVLHPAQTDRDIITITSERFRDNWRYRVALPDLVERARYVRAIVEVLLLEMANRGASDRSAEIPPWLAEGLGQELLVANEIEIILAPPGRAPSGLSMATTQVNARRQNSLERAHRVLRSHPPLTFQELSWPTEDHSYGPSALVYTCSAQLLVHELIALPNGRANLRALLGELPRHYNWQLALLQAYRPQFERPLDIEKWWALRLAQFTGRNLGDRWSPAESWQNLSEALRLKVQVRTPTNEQPASIDVTLQTIMREWSPDQRNRALSSEVRRLQLVRKHVVPPLGPLVDEYIQTLEAALSSQPITNRGLRLPFRKKAPQTALQAEILSRLDKCDAELMRLRPAPKSEPEPADGERLQIEDQRPESKPGESPP